MNKNLELDSLILKENILPSSKIDAELEKLIIETKPEAGTYDTPIEVELIDGNAHLVTYTLDGSVPDEHSTPYTVPIKIRRNKVIRVFAKYSKEDIRKDFEFIIKKPNGFEILSNPSISVYLEEESLWKEK